MLRAGHRPNLESLHVLTVVAREGSLTAAGSRLGMTQQAVSLRIRGLEESFGIPLLLRSSRGSSLTAAGDVIVEWAATLLAAADSFSAAVSSLGSDRRREFRLAASLTIAEHLVPSWLTSWPTGPDTPMVQLTAVNSATVVDLVRAGDADLGFIETPDTPARLSTAVIGLDRLVLVTAPTHPWASRAGVTAAELAATPLLAREHGSGTRRALERALDDAGIPSLVAPAAVIPSSLGIRTTAAAGYAPAVLSRLSVGDDVRAGRLVVIPVDGIDLVRPLTAIWRGEPTSDTTRFLGVVSTDSSGTGSTIDRASDPSDRPGLSPR